MAGSRRWAPSRPRAVYVEAKTSFNSFFGRGMAFSPQPLGRNVDPQGLAGYYCDLAHKGRNALRSPDGLPHNDFGVVLDWSIPVAQAALGVWELIVEGEQDMEAPFLRLADWLVDNAAEGAAGPAWPTDEPMPKYGLGPGWVSAMGQSEAISVLLRAARLTGAPRYRALAEQALGPLLTPVDEGGMARRLDGALVLEEYPAERPVAVLNGWIFSLFGVHELAVATGDARARELFEESSAGLLRLLPRYDAGWWSRYSLLDHHGHADLAKPFYQRLHPELLRGLALLRPDAPELLETASRWEAQIAPLSLARLSVEKLAFRLRRLANEGRGSRSA